MNYCHWQRLDPSLGGQCYFSCLEKPTELTWSQTRHKTHQLLRESLGVKAIINIPSVHAFPWGKVEAGHQWYLQVIYVIGPEGTAGPRVQRSLARRWQRGRRDLAEGAGRPALDDSLIYDNEGDQLKNGTNMKSLLLEREEAAVAASLSQTGASLGSAFAALTLLLLVLSGVCLLARKCRKLRRKREAARGAPEEHPLNTKVELPRGAPKAVGSRCCTVRNIHPPRENGGVGQGQGRKVKQVNLEVKVHSNLHDGTEV